MNWFEINAEIKKLQDEIRPREDRIRELKIDREKLQQEAVAKGGKPHACCNIDGNLVLIETAGKVTGMYKGQPIQGDRVIKQCKSCGAKHHEVSVDPIVINTKGNPTGK